MKYYGGLLFIVVLTTLIHFTVSQIPNHPPTWQMNLSTIIMPCNEQGFTDPSSTKGWGLIDFDWSNAKQIWAKSKPMNCAELLLQQVQMTTDASPGTTTWVYRNSIKALPWYTTVREKLTNKDYSRWFLKFDPSRTPHVPKCDNNYHPPLCSEFYHDQTQTPEYPHGDGDCAAPACDVGSIPVGEYLWDPRAWNMSIHGQTLGQWFINDYIFDKTGGGNPKVSGFFFDDYWSVSGGPSEFETHAVEDMGLSHKDLEEISGAYQSNMADVYKEVLKRGKFSWQQLWTGQGLKPGDIASTCPRPLVTKQSCAARLRELCSEKSPTQSRFLMYSFYPGGCKGNPDKLEQFEQDLANFLLIRGPYAALGHGWLGCSLKYERPAALDSDFGHPEGLCHEVSNGVFRRKWTKATVEMNCNNWKATITKTE
eukprot:TRINITY_DN2294_c0_g1_i1.p1 TRINITY_DN2294_c0_g1~~TRINITY_DN2294_c0_g1_i1.p1  ORF type:complete len:424 (+),score=76.26 TRINITY_DN2294_c0_g1_i1:67-1338(+)